ncbi:DnaT-like ssDNA-binding protein [Sphingomonas sp. MMS24-JH45]
MTDTPHAWTIRAGNNSYISLADAQAIADTRLFATPWTAAGEQKQSQALITATALLDRLRWGGDALRGHAAAARGPACPIAAPMASRSPPTPRRLSARLPSSWQSTS